MSRPELHPSSGPRVLKDAGLQSGWARTVVFKAVTIEPGNPPSLYSIFIAAMLGFLPPRVVLNPGLVYLYPNNSKKQKQRINKLFFVSVSRMI